MLTEGILDFLACIILVLFVVIGFKYAQGVNQVGEALTQHQIEKYGEQK